ncbi:MAG: gamma-glutamyl-gamma-aminobutyrate hydrolase family protein, partial [Actinomycetota bacterium]
MRALIAVAGRPVEPGGVKGWPSANAVAAPGSYLEAIHRAGGREAVLMPTPIGGREAEKMLARFDGLLLLGGGDVDPSRYGAEVHPRTYGIRANRDEFEVALVEAALSRGMPLLAVCRGLQVLNVALGGTLEQHIADRGGPIDHGFGPEWTTHPVKLEA